MTATIDTIDRATSNGKLADIIVRTNDLEWAHFGGGIEFKLLRVSPENGSWAVLFNCPPGSSFASHRHFGAGEYLVISGVVELRGGEQNGGVTARAGDYGYEANSVYHYSTAFPVQTVLYFQNFGPLGFLDENDNVVAMLDWEDVLNIWNAGGAPRD
ncbi:MAG: 2,4'-dihydroxyacetophenone dioxygenase family protein [Ilumatobacteraceae bacterium]